VNVKYLTYEEVVEIHDSLILEFGGSFGIRDQLAIQSALNQPKQSAFGHEFYPTLPEKAAALGFFLTMNHGFVDGNKRTAIQTMEVVLVANGWFLEAIIDEKEMVILEVAMGNLNREGFATWVTARSKPLQENLLDD